MTYKLQFIYSEYFHLTNYSKHKLTLASHQWWSVKAHWTHVHIKICDPVETQISVFQAFFVQADQAFTKASFWTFKDRVTSSASAHVPISPTNVSGEDLLKWYAIRAFIWITVTHGLKLLLKFLWLYRFTWAPRYPSAGFLNPAHHLLLQFLVSLLPLSKNDM